MALFGNKDKNKPSTLEEIKRAYENLSDDDKKSFYQSIADRVHESIAAQEREQGQEDSQSAEAREHEALGEEHDEGKGETEELGEKDDTPEEKAEDKIDELKEEQSKESKPETDRQDEWRSGIEARIASLEKALADSRKEPQEASEEESEKLTALEKKFND